MRGGGGAEQNEHELCKSKKFWGDGVSGGGEAVQGWREKFFGGLQCIGHSLLMSPILYFGELP